MKTINAMMLSLAALTIAGCSQNEVTEISPDAGGIRCVHGSTNQRCGHDYGKYEG